MSIDLANGYIRKDGSSASNIYYGYSYNTSASDGDKVFAIRKVTTVGGVETVTWTNGSSISYLSSWTDRAASFTAPSGSLGLTWSTYLSPFYTADISWSLLTGVNIYQIIAKNESGSLLNMNGTRLEGQYVNDKTYTTEVFNTNSVSFSTPTPGTYSITIVGKNVAGTTSSTITFNLS